MFWKGFPTYDMNLCLTLSMCYMEYSAFQGEMVDLGPLLRCLSLPGGLQGASFADLNRPRCQHRFCLEKVVVAGNGTTVFPHYELRVKVLVLPWP